MLSAEEIRANKAKRYVRLVDLLSKDKSLTHRMWLICGHLEEGIINREAADALWEKYVSI